MSEEETEKNDDGNVGTSLLTALFDTVENKEYLALWRHNAQLK